MSNSAAKEVTQEEINVFIAGLVAKNVSEDEIYNSISKKTSSGIINAIRSYKQYLKDTGQILSAADRKEKIESFLTANIKPDFDLDKAIVHLVKVAEITVGTAKAHIKKFCEANNIIYPAVSVVGEVHNWLLSNKECTKEDFLKFMSDTKRKSATANAYWSSFKFAIKCHNTWTDEKDSRKKIK